MKQATKIGILILCFLVLVSSVTAIYYPSGLGSLANFPANIVLQDGFQVNATDIVARGNFIGNGSLITNILASSVQDVWVNESGDTMSGNLQINANLSVNNSVLIGSGTEWLSIYSLSSIGYLNSTNPLAITNNLSVQNITAGEWRATPVVDTYLSSLNASKLLNIPYLNNLILVDWTNVTNRITHVLNLTDDINYSSKNVNSSTYWDGFDTAADLNLENHTFAEISANLGNFSAWDKSYGDLLYVPTHLTNFTNDLNLENHTFAEISANIGNFSAWDKSYSDLTNKPTVLSNFTDDLGNRGYTHLTNFTNDLNLENHTFAEISSNLGNFSAWDKSYGDLINTPTVLSNFTDDLGNRGYTHLTNFTNNLNLENHTFAEISANIGNWSADKATGFSGECANASSVTVVNGLITSCT